MAIAGAALAAVAGGHDRGVDRVHVDEPAHHEAGGDQGHHGGRDRDEVGQGEGGDQLVPRGQRDADREEERVRHRHLEELEDREGALLELR
jgi:hypothetical protein